MNLERNYDNLFQYFCKNNHLEEAKILLQIKPTINISAKDEQTFMWVFQPITIK